MNNDAYESKAKKPGDAAGADACDDVREWLTCYLLNDLEPDSMADIRLHLETCEACQALARELEPTLDLLRDTLAASSPAPARLSDTHRRRIRQDGHPPAARRRTHRRRWLLKFHVLEIAALALISLILIPVFVSSGRRFGQEARVSACRVADDMEHVVLEESPSGPPIAELAAGRTPEPLPARQAAREPLDAAWHSGRPGLSDRSDRSDISDVSVTAGVKPETVGDASVMRGVYSSRSPGRRGSDIGGGNAAVARDAAPPPPRTYTYAGAVGDERVSESEVSAGITASRLEQDLAGLTVPERRDHLESKIEQLEQEPVLRQESKERETPADKEETVSSGAKTDMDGDLVATLRLQGRNDIRPSDKSDMSDKPAAPAPLAEPDDPSPTEPRFTAAGVNPFVETAANPFSTFSIDVNSASYTVARHYMQRGTLPPPESVRTEEFVNFFDYAYPAPERETFRVYAEAAPSRFGRGLHLLKIGVKGRRLGREEQRRAVLTFLVDTSGSMNRPDRIGLIRKALDMMLDKLDPEDEVAIVPFDAQARLLLDHTPVSDKARIREAIRSLQCGGGTNLEAGMDRAYALAARRFKAGSENRVLLLSDGVVNLGALEADEIFKRIESYRRQGLTLSVFGFGSGVYDDTMLKTLAMKGQGAYAFIDSEQEARRVFVDDLSATLNAIATDVRIQVEFNPARIVRHRQLGYESRQLEKEQFRDESVTAGEVGSGQSVTALYEMGLAPDSASALRRAEQMRPANDWFAVVRVRYRRHDTGALEEIEHRIAHSAMVPRFEEASIRFRLAACVARFSEILRGSPFAQGARFQDVAEILRPIALDLQLDSRVQELARMVELAEGMTRR